MATIIIQPEFGHPAANSPRERTGTAIPADQRRATDRRLFLTVAIFVPVVVLTGFARSYYLKAALGGPPLPSLLVHVHGAVMTAWLVLFAAQVWLVRAKQVRMHMRLGILGLLLAIAMIVVGTATGLAAAQRGASPPGTEPLSFLVIPLGDMLVFATLFGLGMWFRRRPDLHKRFILLAAVNLMGAAVARIPLSFIAHGGPFAFFGLVDLCIIASVTFDAVRNRRLHPVLLWGTIAIIVFQPLRLILGGTALWISFSGWLVHVF